MDEKAFVSYLRRGGRTPEVRGRVIRLVRAFEGYLKEELGLQGLEEASPGALEGYVARVESGRKGSAKTDLWAIRYYFDFTGNEAMRETAGLMREERMVRKPFSLGKFRGVDPEQIERLAAAGIRNVKQMLEAGRTGAQREALAEQSGVPLGGIEELVGLSDLARIPGVKGIRARLYLDAGVDSMEKMAGWEPEALREMLEGFVERTGFEGVAPLPAEARFSVARARELPRAVEYDE